MKWPTCNKMIMDQRDGERLFHKRANEIHLSRCPWGEAIRSDVLTGYLKHPDRVQEKRGAVDSK